MAQPGQPMPTPITTVALIDTGASATVIQSGIAQQLNLQPVGAVQINTPSHAGIACPVYAIQVVIPGVLLQFEITAIEAPLQGQGIGALLGRDILASCVLIYQGWVNSFTLAV